MKHIGTINRNTINKKDKAFLGVFSVITVILLIIGVYLTLDELNIITLLTIPVMVITTIFHEWLHILCFKWFGKGQATIKVLREKKLGAIVIFQSNEDIYYSKKETYITLITPFTIITLISIPLLFIQPIACLIWINCMTNMLGSCLDCGLIYKLKREYPKNIQIKYQYTTENGVSLHIYN